MSKSRYLLIINFIICAVLSGVAFYYNYIRDIPLCPLCSLQLLCYYLIGMISLIAFFHAPEKAGRYFYAILLLLLTLCGLLFSSRQIWLQQTSTTPGLPCAAGLFDMLNNFPWSKIWHTIFYGRGDCILMHWHFIGFSMAAWSLFFFVILIITGLMLLLNAHREVD